MTGYTSDGIAFPEDDDNLKPLAANFRKLAESVQGSMDNVIGMRRITPSSITTLGGSAAVDDLGGVMIKNANEVSIGGVFPWDTFRAFRVLFAFTDVTANTSFSAQFMRSKAISGGDNYGWVRRVARPGEAIPVPDGDKTDDGFPLTTRPGSDSYSLHSGTLDIARAGLANSTHGRVSSLVNLGRTMTLVDVGFGHHSAGKLYDGIKIGPTDGGINYDGYLLFYAYN